MKGLAITTPGFGRIGHTIGALKLPTVMVQEGGYLAPELGDNLASFLDGFTRA
jgi:acetoin utilization deacetylase AcuC-like enzyme